MANEVSLENVIRRCGDFGRYQFTHFALLSLICLGSGINAFYYIFGVAEPSFRCRLPSSIWSDEDHFQSINDTHQHLINTWISATSKCDNLNGTKCTDFVYDRSVFGRTLTEDTNLVCTNEIKRTWLATVYQIGISFTLLSGPIGDKVGRRKVIQTLTLMLFIIPVIIQLLLQFIHMTIDIKFVLLLISQLIAGMGPYSMVFLLLMELTSSSHTSFASSLALVAYTIGEVVATIFSYVARDWLNLKWLTSAYFGLIVLYLYFVPESPYWLFSQKRYAELEVCLRKIAVTNGRGDTDWFSHYTRLIEDPIRQIKTAKQTERKKITRALPRLCVSGLIAFVTMLLYIKISYGLGAMNDNFSPHWNIVIGAVVESIGYISASLLITTTLGRKYALMGYAILTSMCVFAIPFLQKPYPILTIIISQIGKLTISGAVAVSWIYVPELLPTSIRGLGNAVFVFVGRFGAILAPIIDAILPDKYKTMTFYVYSALTFIMVGIIFLLPETRNRSFNDGEERNPTDISVDDFDRSNHRTGMINKDTE